jgi:hypothetical protein
MFIGGRQFAAADLWAESVPAGTSVAAPMSEFYAWWDLFLRPVPSRDVFLFATDARHLPFAMPMLAYRARTQGLDGTLAELVYSLYGNNRRMLYGLHNYARYFALNTSIGGGRILEGLWPALFRSAWVDTLRAFKPGRFDYTGYQPLLGAVTNAGLLATGGDDDCSLAGLKQTTPLIETGYEQGEGKLIPVGTVTARDLMNYGWEMNSLQMGARYHFVLRSWGVEDLAKKIFDEATRDIRGLSPFFEGDLQRDSPNLQPTLLRLQMVDDLAQSVKVSGQPFSADMNNAEAARLFYKRCWLRPYDVRWQAWTLNMANQADEMTQMLARYHRECGPMSDLRSMAYLSSISQQKIDQVANLKDLRNQLANSVPVPVPIKIDILGDGMFPNMSRLEQYRKLEQLFWEYPDYQIEHKVIKDYIHVCAFDSVKRFYFQMRKLIESDVQFSNLTGPFLWAVGFMQKDEELMRTAMEDSDTGSYQAILLAFWNSAAHDDDEGMSREMDYLIERYESKAGTESTGRILKGFVPLLPALKDPKHPDHGKALDYFGKRNEGQVLRTILVLRCGLSTNDAIRFLGGQETDRYRNVLMTYLLKDKERMKVVFADYEKNTVSDVRWVMAKWMYHDLVDGSASVEDKDLSVPGATSIRQAVLEKLGSRRPRGIIPFIDSLLQ